MCPPYKPKFTIHPILRDSFHNSLLVKCIIITSHDILYSSVPYIICSACYKPKACNRILTRYTHTFQYGNVPIQRCHTCGKPCCTSRPIVECQECLRAYYQFISIARKNESTFERLIGISINPITLAVEYGLRETRTEPIDPNELLTILDS